MGKSVQETALHSPEVLELRKIRYFSNIKLILIIMLIFVYRADVNFMLRSTSHHVAPKRGQVRSSEYPDIIWTLK